MTRCEVSTPHSAACASVRNLTIAMLLIAGCFPPLISQTQIGTPSAAGTSHVFIANQGQWHSEALFLARLPGLEAWVTSRGIVFDYYRMRYGNAGNDTVHSQHDPAITRSRPTTTLALAEGNDNLRREGHVLRMRCLGTNDASAVGKGKRDAYHNYFAGRDSTRWARRVPLFDEVRLENLYDGISMRIYFDEGNLRYDFIVAPGADPRQIVMDFEGEENSRIDERGHAELTTSIGAIVHGDLLAYQQEANEQVVVNCRFLKRADGVFGFNIGEYDPEREFIIDPLVYSTFIGDASTENIWDMCVDTDGNAIVAGYTHSPKYPTTPGAYQRESDEFLSGFITKLHDQGSALLFSTFVASKEDHITVRAIAIDKDNDIYFCTSTGAHDFPTSSDAYQQQPKNSNSDALLGKLAADGDEILLATFYGGKSQDIVSDIHVDSHGGITLIGTTQSNDLDITAGAFDSTCEGGCHDLFVAKFNSRASQLLFSTYLGGSRSDIKQAHHIGSALDQFGNVYIGGTTISDDFPLTEGAIDTVFEGEEGFLAKLSPDLDSLKYSTFIGGKGDDIIIAIDLDANENIVIGGLTFSVDFPKTHGVFGPRTNDVGAFIMHIDGDSFEINFSTLMGNTAGEINGLDTGSDGSIAFGGMFIANNLHTTAGAIQRDHPGGPWCGFVGMINADGSQLRYSSYLGGDRQDIATSLVIGPGGDIYLAGYTQSHNFPVTVGAYDESHSGIENDFDSFVLRLGIAACSFEVDFEQDSYTCRGRGVRLQPGIEGEAGKLKYEWTPQIGLDDATSSSPLASPDSTTIYTLRVIDEAGCIAAAATTVHVKDDLHADAGPDLLLSCKAAAVGIGGIPSGSGGIGTLFYQWIPEAGLDDPQSANPTLDRDDLKPGDETVYTLIVTDSLGCSSTASMRVMIVNKLHADAGPDYELSCSTASVILGGRPTGRGGAGGLSYRWTPQTGLDDPLAANPKLGRSALRPGSEIVYTLTLSDSLGCSSTSSIQVSTADDLIVAAETAPLLCPDEIGRLHARLVKAGGAGVSYSWQPPNGLDNVNSSSPTVSLPRGGSYPYTVMVRDENGCEASSTIIVRVRARPRLRFSPALLSFPALVGCANATSTTIRLLNPGAESLTINDIEFEAAFGLDDIRPPLTIPAGQELELPLRFAPTETGLSEGWAYFTLAACGGRDSLRLRGRASRVDLSILPTDLDFGILWACDNESEERGIVLRNQSADSLHLDKLSIPLPFSIGSAPHSIAPGDSLELALRFTPPDTGSYNAGLRIAYTVGACQDEAVVNLSGRAEEPLLTIDKALFNFGPAAFCEVATSKSAELFNPGSRDIAVRTFSAGSLEPDIELSPAPPFVVPAGESIALKLSLKNTTSATIAADGLLIYSRCDRELDLRFQLAIAAPLVDLPDTLRLGDFLACRDSELGREFGIAVPQSDAAIRRRIEQVSIAGPFAASINAGDSLLPGSSFDFKVQFLPPPDAGAGRYSGWIDLLIQPCNQRRRIHLVARKSVASLTVSPVVVEFGDLPVGAIRLQTFGFRNSGSTTLTISALDTPPPPSFTILSISHPLPAILAPEEKLTVTLRYIAVPGATSITLAAVSDHPCPEVVDSAVLRGRGTRELGWTVVCTDSIRTITGQRLSVPLILESSHGIDFSKPRHYEAQLRFNKSLLAPRGATPKGREEGDDRVILVSGTMNKDRGPLAELDFIATWGNDSCTAIRIDTVIWPELSVVTEVCHGTVCLDDICRAGDAHRFYLGAGSGLALRVRETDPAGEIIRLDYSTPESGLHRLLLFDALGNQVARLLRRHPSAGSYQADLPAGALAKGIYIIVLQTPTQHRTQSMRLLH